MVKLFLPFAFFLLPCEVGCVAPGFYPLLERYSDITGLDPAGSYRSADACGALGMYMWFLLPAQARLGELIATYDGTRQTQVRNQVARKTQEELSKVRERLPAQKEFTGLSAAISELAKENSVRIPGMGCEIEAMKDGLALKGALSFDAAGRYEAIRRFIYEVETSDPYLFIEKLTAKRSKKKLRQVAFKIQIGIFLRPDQVASTSSGAK